MNTPLVSIITPSFNQAQFLEQTIQSVLAQDYRNIEYIVIDGLSTDGSAGIIRKYTDRLAFWCSEKDTGQASAINKGFGHAHGEILAWLNSDDLLSPSAVRLAVEFLSDDKEIGLVYGDRLHIDPRGNVIGLNRMPAWYPGMLKQNITLPQETVFFRRDLYHRAGPLDENLKFALDFDLWCRMARLTNFRHIPAFLGSFREHDESKSVNFSTYQQEAREVYTKHFARPLPKGLPARWNRLLHHARLAKEWNAAARKADLARIRKVPFSNTAARTEPRAPTSGRIPGLVSVIIPAYNAQQSLSRCIDKVFAQTYNNIELIVVNDGSADGTEQVALSYGNRLRYIKQQNQGETAARNAGFALAKGELLTFVDHDDYWEPTFIETTVNFLRQHPEAVAVSVGSAHRNALKDGLRIQPAFLSAADPTRQPIILDNFFTFWADHDHICAGSAMLRGSLYDSAGGQRTDLALSGDMEYWAYLATFGPWGFIPQILLNVDGTQVPKGNLYQKFHSRYTRCVTVESWQKRIEPRLADKDREGFERVRGRVATWYTFAHVFVGRDTEARRCASLYQRHLEGKFGKLWRLGLSAGWASWKPLGMLLRLRTRLQYARAEARTA